MKLDIPTLLFCAALARKSAEGVPNSRPQRTIAAEALKVLAEEIEAIARGG